MGTLFRLTSQGVRPAAGQRVIKAADLAMLVEANDLLATARARVAKMEGDAQAEYDRRSADGYRDGQEEGRLEHAEKLLETVLSSVDFIENIESTLVNVVSQAVRKVVGELDDNERIVRIVRNALISVRNQQKVIVRVAPADEVAVSDALRPMLQSTPGSGSFLDVIGDPRLERGACMLESELGVVDASLETQLKAFDNAFKAKLR
ncbi:MAG: HrpE/YscL family type III secretion apparatus protein [Pseudomonadota bacterium]